MFNRSRKSQSTLGNKAKRAPRTSLTHLYHGIGITAGDTACAAVEAIAQQRFLSEDAPRLPLEQCANPGDCVCRYKHFSDRRTDPRRESDVGLPQADHPQEKRQSGGRRITDD